MQILLTHIKKILSLRCPRYTCYVISKESTVNVNGSEMCKYKTINYKKDVQSDS